MKNIYFFFIALIMYNVFLAHRDMKLIQKFDQEHLQNN